MGTPVPFSGSPLTQVMGQGRVLVSHMGAGMVLPDDRPLLSLSMLQLSCSQSGRTLHPFSFSHLSAQEQSVSPTPGAI